MLKELIKKIDKIKNIEKDTGLTSWSIWYFINNYGNNKFFKLLLHLRKKGTDINSFIDKHNNLKNE